MGIPILEKIVNQWIERAQLRKEAKYLARGEQAYEDLYEKIITERSPHDRAVIINLKTYGYQFVASEAEGERLRLKSPNPDGLYVYPLPIELSRISLTPS